MTSEQLHVEQLYDNCRTYFTKFQKKIDQHWNYIDEFCQKTSINKKGIANQSNYKKKTANGKAKKFRFFFSLNYLLL